MSAVEVSEAKLDEVELALQRKIETMSGFADLERQAAQLQRSFAFFDSDGSGNIDFAEFEAAMVRLNFVGVQSVIEALFERYDEDCSGSIDYNEFSKGVFGLGQHVRLNATSRSVVERVRSKILERGGANGIRTLTAILRRMDSDGSGNLDRDELVQGLSVLGVRDLDDSEGGDVDKLMTHFDRDRSGRITVEEFLRGVRGGMPKRRVKLVRQAFALLDRTGDGRVLQDDFLAIYDATQHPEVAAGRMSVQDATSEFMEVFESGAADGEITFEEFLDYYKDLSAGIEEDDYFELMIRNAWHISGGEGWCANTSCRRVLVTFTDGSQDVVEIQNDLGIAADDIDTMRARLEEQGVTDIAKISLTH